jgi:hypothetical protein
MAKRVLISLDCEGRTDGGKEEQTEYNQENTDN